MNCSLVDDDTIQAQARTVLEAEGFAAFRPTAHAYRYDIVGLSSEHFPPERLYVLSIAEIEPPLRCVGVALFPRAKRILDGILRGDALPPIYVELLPEFSGPYRYRTTDGFHRFHLSRALGLSQIPAIVWPSSA
ncbi:hypothetical protein [Burkholderia thailandensis]|uniref:hypothetical protein n=1 Tax=Burkholderia thailandensis TaxID=57975 RepID=UPI00107ECB09|nr:hypothetical protein [Burkholderia thailandensis]TGB31565.1 hypothetical protein C6946_22405 [Burkholderia thailandensis]